jgi:hypothetical protein
MGFFGRFKRNVGKFYGVARGIAKAIEGGNRAVTKMTGGAIDPMAMLKGHAMRQVEDRVGSQMVSKVKDGYAGARGMVRDVQGGDYASAARRGHGMARQGYDIYRRYGV